jgi:hypothetical protein
MEALELFEEKERMCKCYTNDENLHVCMDECPLSNYIDCKLNADDANRYDKKEILIGKIKKIEEWSKKHPRKTYLQDFKEKFSRPFSLEKVCRKHLYEGSDKQICSHNCVECWNEEMGITK